MSFTIGKQFIKDGAGQVVKQEAKHQIGKHAGKNIINEVKEKTSPTSREARREAMRDAGIPTSQQPISQSKNTSGREYSYETPKEGGGTQIKSVQQQTMDRSHQGQPHWEAGSVKTDQWGNTRNNSFDRPKLGSEKAKVTYD